MKLELVKTDYRPDNYLDILRDNCSLEWIKANAKFYLLDHKNSSANALIWKTPNSENKGWSGVSITREYEQSRGYYYDFSPLYIDVEHAVYGGAKKYYDITCNFDDAIKTANLHTI